MAPLSKELRLPGEMQCLEQGTSAMGSTRLSMRFMPRAVGFLEVLFTAHGAAGADVRNIPVTGIADRRIPLMKDFEGEPHMWQVSSSNRMVHEIGV